MHRGAPRSFVGLPAGWWRAALAAAVVAAAWIGPLSAGADGQTTNPLAISISGSTTATVGVFYQATASAHGGHPPYSWSKPGEPPGLQFSLAGGTPTVSGTPTSAGTFSVVFIVSDTNSDGFRGSTTSGRLTITVAPAPPPPTTATTTTTSTTIAPPRTTPTTGPHPTTTMTTATTLPVTTVSTTVPPVTTPTTSPTAPVPTGPLTPLPPSLTLSRPSIEPGGRVIVGGNGCPAGSNVQLSIAGAPVATAVADGSGAFSAPVLVPDLALGRYDVAANCGPTLSSPLDVVIASSVDSGTGVLGLFFFFLLLALMLFRRRRLVRRRGAGLDPLSDDTAPSGTI